MFAGPNRRVLPVWCHFERRQYRQRALPDDHAENTYIQGKIEVAKMRILQCYFPQKLEFCGFNGYASTRVSTFLIYNQALESCYFEIEQRLEFAMMSLRTLEVCKLEFFAKLEFAF